VILFRRTAGKVTKTVFWGKAELATVLDGKLAGIIP